MTAKTDHVVDLPTKSTTDVMSPPKEGSFLKLIVCFVGIFCSYFVYGLLQEKITKGEYGENKDRFTYTLSLVFVQCIINAIFAQLAIMVTTRSGADNKTLLLDTTPHTLYALMAFSYLGAMLASNHSLQYVSYPTQVLGKSAKPIPVMILGVLVAKKRYPIQKYMFVLLIVIGVAMFIFKDSKSGKVQEDQTLGWGGILLVTSLLLDGVTGGVQDRIRADHRPQTHRMMLCMNLWSILYLAAALLLSGEVFRFIEFASKYPEVLFSMLTFSLCSSIGQNFIFMTVTAFGPLTCSIITTTRKFFTILASVIIFQNPMASRQWMGTALVFAGLGLDSVYGKSKPKNEKVDSKK